jgi:capsule polysaccharide export protein KpsE/RkpR
MAGRKLGILKKRLGEEETVAQHAVKPQTEIPTEEHLEVFLPQEPRTVPLAGDDLVPKLRSLWSQRRLLAQVTGVCLALATLAAFLLPVRYDAATRLMPPDTQPTAGLAMLAALSSKSNSASPGLTSMAGDLLGVKSSGALFIGILGSDTVQDRIIERFDLRRVYGSKFMEDARLKLGDKTNLKEDRKSGIVTVVVSDRDPKRAAAIAAAYVEELNKLVAQLSTSSARRERIFLEDRLIGVKHDLDQATQDFSQFSSKNKTVEIKEEAKAMLQGAASVEGELIGLESQLRGLQAIYTDNNVRVRSVKARISELQQQLQNIGGGAHAAAPSADGNTQSQFPSLRNLPLLGATYADLYRRVQIQEAVYETLTQQFELAKVQEAKEIPSVKVLDPPSIPERKSFPPRLLIMAMGILVGLVAGSVIVLGQQAWNSIDPQEPGKILASEVLQTVNAKMPWATPNGSRLQAGANRVWVKFVGKNGSNGVQH